MEQKKQNKTIELPENMCCGRFQCSDCVFFDKTEYNKYGECLCRMTQKYVPADDWTCGDFEWKK